LRSGEYQGERDVELDALKRQAAFAQGLLGLEIPQAFRDKLQSDLATIKPQIEKTTAIDFLTDSAYAAGARSDLLASLDHASIEVVPDTQIESDAAYDETREVIMVRQSLVDDVQSDLDALAKRSVVDKVTGAVLKPKALKNSSEFHDLAVLQALIGAHELGHADDDTNGVDAQPVVDLARQAVAGQDVTNQLVSTYLDTFEYDSYLAQERYQWEMGEAPQSTRWLTIDNHGNPINRELAVRNITAFVTKTGFDATSVLDILGGEFEGGRIPGGRIPGDQLPGGRIPGGRIPGGRIPGGRIPGGRIPGYGRY
jgi:hypothetical protein